MTGYLHHDYAKSLSEFGEPLLLPKSGGWLLKRPIDKFADAMGIYPLFACADWKALKADLRQLDRTLVSVIVVTDPFGEYDEDLLRQCFPNLLRPFKLHFVNDLSMPLEDSTYRHHARNVRIGISQVGVERCEDPSHYLDDWTKLYSLLTERHRISGIRAFSRESFARQLTVPGITSFRAFRGTDTVGMILWYVQCGVAYYHLGAYTDEGYRLRASFALFRTALNYFAECGLSYVSLGAGAGILDDAEDGLSRFKRGWSNGVRTAYICGRIFDLEKYQSLISARPFGVTDYFPAYRQGEFN
jgi:hypothetical protein